MMHYKRIKKKEIKSRSNHMNTCSRNSKEIKNWKACMWWWGDGIHSGQDMKEKEKNIESREHPNA